MSYTTLPNGSASAYSKFENKSLSIFKVPVLVHASDACQQESNSWKFCPFSFSSYLSYFTEAATVTCSIDNMKEVRQYSSESELNLNLVSFFRNNIY